MIASTVPGFIAWPLLGFMVLVLVGRLHWCDNNLYERYFNNTLVFLMLAQLLREHVVQNLLVRSSLLTLPGTWQLGTAVLSYSFTEFLGFTQLWSGRPESETRRRQTYYRLAALFLIVGFLVFGSRARNAAEPIEFLRGWDFVATLTCSMAMLVFLAARLIWNSVRELRKATRRRERLIAACTLAMGLAGILTVFQEAALQITDWIGWTHTAAYRQQYHASGLFYLIFSVFATAAVPLGVKLIGVLGLDRISRSWCALQPLRQAMRATVPECAFDRELEQPGRRKTELQLHHTVVEIRDALLRLRPYLRETPPADLARFAADHNTAPTDAAITALRLAQAARRRDAGAIYGPLDFEAELIARTRAATLEDEAAHLVELARWWPAAYAWTATQPDPAATMHA